MKLNCVAFVSKLFSFVFLRLSSLAETVPQNQHMYVNKSRASIIKILKVLLMALFNLFLYELKRFVLSGVLKEYDRCMK